MASTKLLRSLLDTAWDATPEGASLRDSLRANEKAAQALITGGSQSSVGANGRHSALVVQTTSGSVTQVEIVEAWRRLVDAFDEAASTLGLRITGEDDNAIYTRMMTVSLRDITGYTMNFMYLSK